jgi:hypothetical protein
MTKTLLIRNARCIATFDAPDPARGRELRDASVGLLLRWFYYSEGIGTAFLDRVPGLAQPDDTPLAWTLMMLSLMLVYDRFFNAYLLREKAT